MTRYEEVRFPSQGAQLYGRLYRPSSSSTSPAPAIAMAHGTSATITMTADKYAEAFAERGVCALVYDHINFGRSGGEARGEINPWQQGRGYLHAIDFLVADDRVDAERLAIWGDSFSAGVVLAVAPCDERIKAVVAQLPSCGVDPPARAGTAEEFETFRDLLLHADFSAFDAVRTGPMPIVSFDQVGTPSLLQPIQAFRWFIEYGGRFGSAWVNRGTRVTPKTAVPFSPYVTAAHMHASVLIMSSPDDEFPHCRIPATRATFDMMPSRNKALLEIDGGHFGLLHWPSAIFDVAVRAQGDFIARTFRTLRT